jgi:hypothetical protein
VLRAVRSVTRIVTTRWAVTAAPVSMVTDWGTMDAVLVSTVAYILDARNKDHGQLQQNLFLKNTICFLMCTNCGYCIIIFVLTNETRQS